jgi:glycosyltransferase involved in cell wall biosynthesis
MHIGVITSMKKGLDLFVYRELETFSRQNCTVSIFPTKCNAGLYNARDDWHLHKVHLLLMLLLQPLCFLKSPVRYLRLLREAIAYNALIECMLAWYFVQFMGTVDVIYAVFGDKKLFTAYFCKQIIQKPLNVTIHAYELYQNPNPRMFERALAACDQIVTVTEYNRELLRDRYHIDPARVEVIRICVDLEDFQPQDKFVILIVGFFAEKKGHEILLRAIKQLNQDDLEVWVVGGSSATSVEVDVEALARELGVDSQVVFFGPLRGNALKAVYYACDVFCLPSRFDSHGVAEGFPTVIAEAMAMGKPVISTRHVEIPRVVKEIVVDENDVEGLAQAIRQVYESPELRRRLGEQNRATAEQLFSMRNAERMTELLSGLATQAGTTIDDERQQENQNAPARG